LQNLVLVRGDLPEVHRGSPFDSLVCGGALILAAFFWMRGFLLNRDLPTMLSLPIGVATLPIPILTTFVAVVFARGLPLG
jgi:hypothetical protein